jgi:hydrogenase/urease accessory protein HupE
MTTGELGRRRTARASAPPWGVLLAVVGMLLGSWMLYGFGAGYFALALPNPLNVIAASVLFVGLVAALWRYATAPSGRSSDPPS